MVCTNRKSLASNLQLRDSLIAKIIFHQIQADEMAVNLQETNREVSMCVCLVCIPNCIDF